MCAVWNGIFLSKTLSKPSQYDEAVQKYVEESFSLKNMAGMTLSAGINEITNAYRLATISENKKN